VSPKTMVAPFDTELGTYLNNMIYIAMKILKTLEVTGNCCNMIDAVYLRMFKGTMILIGYLQKMLCCIGTIHPDPWYFLLFDIYHQGDCLLVVRGWY
jgi:hypothetical protein